MANEYADAGEHEIATDFGVNVDSFRLHIQAEGRSRGCLGAKPPEKGPLGLIGPEWLFFQYEGMVSKAHKRVEWTSEREHNALTSLITAKNTI